MTAIVTINAVTTTNAISAFYAVVTIIEIFRLRAIACNSATKAVRHSSALCAFNAINAVLTAYALVISGTLAIVCAKTA